MSTITNVSEIESTQPVNEKPLDTHPCQYCAKPCRGKQCKECHCFMPMKCKISNLPCPLGYWDIVEDISETDNIDTINSV